MSSTPPEWPFPNAPTAAAGRSTVVPPPPGADEVPAPPPGSSFPGRPALPGMFPAGGEDPFGSSRTGRSWGAVVLVVLLSLGPLAGLAYGIWAWNRSDDAADDAREVLDTLTIPDVTVPEITIADVTVPGFTVPASAVPPAPPATPAVVLFAGSGPSDVAAQFDAAVTGAATRYGRIVLYPDYAFATARTGADATAFAEYTWRSGAVGAARPVEIGGTGDVEAALFSSTDVDWVLVPTLIAGAPGLTAVPDGSVSHVIVDRSAFLEGNPLTIKVHVSGSGASSYVEYSTSGEVLAVR